MHQPRAERLAFAALIVANLVLAAGPWMVRLADVGPVAAGFWRLAIALPFLVWLAAVSMRGKPPPAWPLVGAVALGGLFFAADLAAWHEGILRTKLANSTLFGNFASFIFALYGFVILRALPRPIQVAALLLAAAGAALLLGEATTVDGPFRRRLLCSLAFSTRLLIAVDHARRQLAHGRCSRSQPPPARCRSCFALVMGETVMPIDWTPLILLSIGSQLIGQGLLVFALGHLQPLVVGVGLLTQPIVSAAIGWAVYGERLALADGLGALLICAALVLIRLPARGVATPDAPAQ